MGLVNVDYNLMIAISLVFLVVSTKLTQQSNPPQRHLFDQQNQEISPSSSSSSSFPSDTSPDELPVFVDATTSLEEDEGEDDDDDYGGIPRNTNKARIPEGKISSRISQQPISSPSSSVVEEDQSADYVNEVNWSRNPERSVRSREKMRSSSKSKRSGCDSGPPLSARRLIGDTTKRSYFATSKAEVARRIQEDKSKSKRTFTEREESGLHPSSCVSTHKWEDLGSNYYPRFVQTFRCLSDTCANGLYQCRAKEYIVKVLKRVSDSDSVLPEPPETSSLPTALSSIGWRLVSYPIVRCCECSNRLAIF